MYSEYLAAYEKTEYLPLIPKESNPDQFIYKFNSVEHMLSYVNHLNEKFPRGSRENSSQTRNDDETGWYASPDFPTAMEIIRGVEFDPKAQTELQGYIRSVRHSTKFSDDGHEIDIPEVLAKSERYWLSADSRRSVSRFFDETLFINASYNSNTRAEEARRAGINLLQEVYKLGIIPRKMVCVFWATNAIDDRGETKGTIPIFIDVSFRDLNGIAKTLHPATFRRMVFRLHEIFPDLRSGYGRAEEAPTTKGMTAISNIIGWGANSQVQTLLGLPQKV